MLADRRPSTRPVESAASVPGGCADRRPARQDEHHVTARTLDRVLPVWIGAAMAWAWRSAGPHPGLGNAISAVQVDGVSLPIAIGLLLMKTRCWPRSGTTARHRHPDRGWLLSGAHWCGWGPR